MSVTNHIFQWVNKPNFTDQVWPVERRIRKKRRLDKPIGCISDRQLQRFYYSTIQKIKNYASLEVGYCGGDSVYTTEISSSRKIVYERREKDLLRS